MDVKVGMNSLFVIISYMLGFDNPNSYNLNPLTQAFLVYLNQSKVYKAPDTCQCH